MLITGEIFKKAIISGANSISNNRVSVDELNVFPVPDGDTGTNMSLTIGNAKKELNVTDNSLNLADMSKTAAGALLRGARGNSGVILSLIFRGLSKGFKECETADGEQLAAALKKSVKSAYGAVMKPTEGTILTVIREASEKAEAAVKSGKTDFVEVFEVAYEGAKEALAKTPEILPVLKKAGVVDAGGAGLVKIFEGMISVFKDDKIIECEDAPSTEGIEKKATNAAAEWEGEITFTYCTEFIVKKEAGKKDDALTLRSYLETIGDCVVVVDDEAIIKVHVHTDNPGKALQKGLENGSLINMKIENMREQHEQAKRNNEIENTVQSDDNGAYTPVKPENDYGFVAVAAGSGIESLFNDLGADHIVSGGQTMNPSTDDILRAVELTPAKTVFVLPNNKNIIMAAEQSVRLATREVIVLQTKSIPMGISAMLAFDPEADAETNATNMQTAADNVGTGSITFAARDSDYEGHKIKQGEILALENNKLSFVDQDTEKAVVKLTKQLFKKDSEFITLIYGEDISEEQAEKTRAAVEAKIPNAEITLIPGGQPVYYYIISVE